MLRERSWADARDTYQEDAAGTRKLSQGGDGTALSQVVDI